MTKWSISDIMKRLKEAGNCVKAGVNIYKDWNIKNEISCPENCVCDDKSKCISCSEIT